MRPSDIAGGILFFGLIGLVVGGVVFVMGWLGVLVCLLLAAAGYLASVLVQNDWNPKNWDFTGYE